MEEKNFIIGINGRICVIDLPFKDVDEILKIAVANKNDKFAKSVEVSEEELSDSMFEFGLAVLRNLKVATKVTEKGLGMEELHRKSLAFAKSKGISLLNLFSKLNDMSDDEMASQLKTIFGITI